MKTMSCPKLKKLLQGNALLLGIFAGVIIGCVVGIATHDAVQSSNNPSPKRLAMYIKFPGELFIRMLKFIVLPLVTSSVIVALTDDAKSSAGKLGKRTIIYYLSTTISSAILGLIVGTIIVPGSGVVKGNEYETKNSAPHHGNPVDSFLDLFRNCFPGNIVEAMFHSTYTIYKETPVAHRFVLKPANTTWNMSAEALVKFIENNLIVPRSLHNTSSTFTVILANDVNYDFAGVAKGGGTNMIGMIVISIAFGIVLKMCKEDGKPLVNIFRSLWTATMKLVEIIMWAAPIGLASIIAGSIVETSDVLMMFRAMAKFVLTIVVGCTILACVFYPTLYFIIVRRNPLQHIKNVLPAFITALGTSSSAATLPTTIECCESRAKIDKRITRFVLPLGATCNMDGVALYMTIVVLFVNAIDPTVNLKFDDIVLTVIVATMLSIGTPAIPGVGVTGLVILLETMGLPLANFGPILAVYWFTDRLITLVNVMGDTYAAAIVEKMSYSELNKDDEEEKPNELTVSALDTVTQMEEPANV